MFPTHKQTEVASKRRGTLACLPFPGVAAGWDERWGETLPTTLFVRGQDSQGGGGGGLSDGLSAFESLLNLTFCSALSNEKRLPPKSQLYLLHHKPKNRRINFGRLEFLKRFCAGFALLISCDCVQLRLEVFPGLKS